MYIPTGDFTVEYSAVDLYLGRCGGYDAVYLYWVSCDRVCLYTGDVAVEYDSEDPYWVRCGRALSL